MTKQGVRNLNALGPKKKRPAAVDPVPAAPEAEAEAVKTSEEIPPRAAAGRQPKR